MSNRLVKCKNVFSAQNYLELITGKCYLLDCHTDDMHQIKEILKANNITDIRNYPLNEIEEVIKNGKPVVLVELLSVNNGKEYRWFEIRNCSYIPTFNE